METLLPANEDVHENTPMPELVSAIRDAFVAYENGNAQMPAKSYIELPEYNGDFRSMPAYLDVRRADDAPAGETPGHADAAGEWDAAGIKWVNVHPNNPDEFGLPTVMGTMIYSDPETAYPLAIMDGTELTMKRTGAAAAVATDELAVPDADSLGIVGAGVQSYTQLEAISTVRDIATVVVSDPREDRVAAFVERFADEFDVRAGTVGEAGHCDVLSTVTPVESPVVSPEDLAEHTHVNAMGADAAGKHELADGILLAATLVIDDYEQTTHSGEINVPWSEGVLSDADLHAEIGEIVTGEKPGRTPADGVTVFDSTGLALQDVAAAHVVYTHADEHGNGTPLDLLGV